MRAPLELVAHVGGAHLTVVAAAKLALAKTADAEPQTAEADHAFDAALAANEAKKDRLAPLALAAAMVAPENW